MHEECQKRKELPIKEGAFLLGLRFDRSEEGSDYVIRSWRQFESFHLGNSPSADRTRLSLYENVILHTKVATDCNRELEEKEVQPKKREFSIESSVPDAFLPKDSRPSRLRSE